MVFLHKSDCGNSRSTFSVNDLWIIAAATEVNIMESPISSAVNTSHSSDSHTHLLTINDRSQSWCAKILSSSRHWIECLLPRAQLVFDWEIRCVFSSLTASFRPKYSNLLMIVFRTVFNSGPLLCWLRTSLPSSTCSWTPHEPKCIFFSSLMISCSGSKLSWADWLLLQCFSNLSQS